MDFMHQPVERYRAIMALFFVMSLQPVHLSMLLLDLSALHSILYRPLASFPYNHCQDNFRLSQMLFGIKRGLLLKTLYQRLLQTEGICRQHNWMWWKKKSQFWFGKSRKDCGKRRKCWLPAFSPFPTMLSKAFLSRVVKSCDCVVKD